jgi:medium-chain acyl-[acyl-carrier-protein] hydrolase
MIVSAAMGSGRLRLFCLPHAGGSSARFIPWARWLSGQAEVIAVDMPGHGRRLPEPLVTEWRPLADDMAAIIGAQADGAYAVFGHSLGALVAFEACRILTGRGHPPALLVVAGRNGPSAGVPHRPIHGLPDEEFLSALRRLGGTQDAALDDPELLEMFLPVLRNDMRLAEVYERAPGPPLSCPIAVFAGRHDALTDDFGLLAWKRETTGNFELHLIDGRHFFLDEPEFTEALAARLARVT